MFLKIIAIIIIIIDNFLYLIVYCVSKRKSNFCEQWHNVVFE